MANLASCEAVLAKKLQVGGFSGTKLIRKDNILFASATPSPSPVAVRLPMPAQSASRPQKPLHARIGQTSPKPAHTRWALGGPELGLGLLK